MVWKRASGKLTVSVSMQGAIRTAWVALVPEIVQGMAVIDASRATESQVRVLSQRSRRWHATVNSGCVATGRSGCCMLSIVHLKATFLQCASWSCQPLVVIVAYLRGLPAVIRDTATSPPERPDKLESTGTMPIADASWTLMKQSQPVLKHDAASSMRGLFCNGYKHQWYITSCDALSCQQCGIRRKS
jgi:hypothetical protein